MTTVRIPREERRPARVLACFCTSLTLLILPHDWHYFSPPPIFFFSKKHLYELKKQRKWSPVQPTVASYMLPGDFVTTASTPFSPSFGSGPEWN